MSGLTTRSLLTCLTLALACGDSDAGSASAGSTSAASTTTATTTTTSTGTTTAPGSTGAPTTSTASASGSTSSGEAPTTGAVDSTGTTATTNPGSTTDPASTGTSTSTSTSDPGTSTGTSTTSGGNGQPPPAPDMAAGCNVCDCCDPWPISWAAVPEATHYVVRWKCSINPEQVHDVGAKTMIADVCNDIDMCNGMCAFTVGYIKVQACNDDGCSALVDIPAAPITCGGGCCC